MKQTKVNNSANWAWVEFNTLKIITPIPSYLNVYSKFRIKKIM